MDREEAIKNLNGHKTEFTCDFGWNTSVIESLDMAIKALEQEPCEDAISRLEAIRIASGYCHWTNIPDELAKLPPVSAEKTDAYKQGWHDAIITALKETHNVHTEEGHFRVVQEETLIGVGMAYEQVSTEKTGRWHRKYDSIVNDYFWECDNCKCGFQRDYPYCPNCGAKMQEETETCKDCMNKCIMYEPNMKGCKDKMEGVEE